MNLRLIFPPRFDPSVNQQAYLQQENEALKVKLQQAYEVIKQQHRVIGALTKKK